MNRSLKRTALLLSTALGLLAGIGTQAWAQAAADPADAGNVLEEIIVTAQKRSESSLDVPMGLTALSGQKLASVQAFRLEDFVGKVPGLNVSEGFGSQLVVRGIVSSATSINAPVATYIDDTPLVGVGAFSGGFANTPNLDTFDLARIEVLKGPQGTLYGANALGGLLKYVTNAPDTKGFSAKVQAGLSTVEDSDDTGHNLHGMINVPLGDTLAVRAVAYDNEYPGFIDDPSRGREDMNNTHLYGGRVALLWTPTDNVSLRLSVFDQQRRFDGINYGDVAANTLKPITCTLCQVRDYDQAGSSKLRLYNATLTWDLGPAQITSSTTYDKWRYRQGQNLIGLNATADFFHGETGSGKWGLFVDNDYVGDDFVHETRLSSDDQGVWNWQVGFYYTSRETFQDQTYIFINRLNHTLQSGELGGSGQPATYKEAAAFGNLNFEVTPEFDISVGGRFSQQSQTFEQIGRLVAPSLPKASMDDTVFTYSADARWRFTPGSMIYGRIASGFVPGGPNIAPLGGVDIPETYASSTTTNYELGYKSTLLDNRLTVEVAAFQINWEDIQLYRIIGIYSTLANGGTAVSRGVEWAFNYVPIHGLTLGFNGAYTDAHLTDNNSADTGGVDGDRLPVTPRWQLAGSAEYKWPMFGVSGFAGADWRYSSNRFADFTPGTRQEMPAYNIFDLRAGVETKSWSLSVYVKNVGDNRAISYVIPETGFAGRYRASYATPRTIGIDLSASF
jgi:iron complex outermembrane receptor protein